MAKAKSKTPEEYREFIEPPLIPGRPAFWRWIGYFKVGPGDTVEDIKKARKLRGLEAARKFMNLEDD
jgi:hypothetical protein